MIMLKWFAKLIQAIRAGDTPEQVAGGFTLGFLIGLMPFFTLQSLVLLLLLILLNVNFAAGTLGILLAGLLGVALDPLFDRIGYFVLTGIPPLKALWETLYNLPLAPLTHFHNTVVMGALLSGLVSAWPIYRAAKRGVVLYRTRLEARVQKWRIVQALRSSKLVQLYQKIRNLGEA